ncbi:uncharacterized protein LOC143657292 isoform X2 [Tamandua tetradactyla]|uniref:uncharacterized protein LOC143657292 isoform X2 n=2 Tax=Tamandua tetradactyla TaxID=48850 RepID=UPI004053969A
MAAPTSRRLSAKSGPRKPSVLSLCLLLLLLLLRLSSGYKEDKTKQVCGRPWWLQNLKSVRHWPWEVSLRVENEHVCGGALIDPSWVVTAAHCIQGTKEYSVMLGTSKLKPLDFTGTLLISVSDIILHPKYWGRTFIMNDIALLQLHTPATLSEYVQPICLPEPNFYLKVGTQCWVTGWGQSKQRFSEPLFQHCGRTSVACRKVRGKLVEEGKWPWQVSILFLGMHICSGTLVNRQWVLTAAHCFQRSKNTSEYSVKMGIRRLSENGTQLLLSHIKIHEKFNNFISEDIALLKLQYPITWSSHLKPVCLPDAKFKLSAGTLCWVTGWDQPTSQGPGYLSELPGRLWLSVFNDLGLLQKSGYGVGLLLITSPGNSPASTLVNVDSSQMETR